MYFQGPAAGPPHPSRLRRAIFSRRAKAYGERKDSSFGRTAAEDGTNGGNFTPQGFAAAPAGGTGLLRLLGRQGPGASCPYGEGPRRALVTFPRWKVTQGFGGAAPQSDPQARFDVSRRRRLLSRDDAAVPNCIIASQAARLVRKNPQFQPHILFSSRRKENVPLTVQEKRAAGGAVPLWRTPPAPLLSAPQTDAFLLRKSSP